MFVFTWLGDSQVPRALCFTNDLLGYFHPGAQARNVLRLLHVGSRVQNANLQRKAVRFGVRYCKRQHFPAKAQLADIYPQALQG